MVTAEFAVALPALVLVVAMCVVAVAAATTRLRCTDAAGVAARLVARGERVDAVRAVVRRGLPGAVVTSHPVAGGLIEVRVSARLVHLAGLSLGATTATLTVADESAPP